MTIDIQESFDENGIECISIGKISDKVFNSIKINAPEFANEIKSRTIMFWKDRIEHIEKHKNDANNLSVTDLLSVIPKAIEFPDYVGIKNKDNKKSLQLIKVLDNGLLIAIRLNNKGKLSFRTAYSVTDSQISDYINKGCLWKIS